MEEQEKAAPKRKWRAIIEEHPGTALAIGAGIAALAGAEWAVGALIGLGAAMLLTRKTGPEMREQLRQRWRNWTAPQPPKQA